MKRRNWAAVAGIVYVLVWVVGLLLESDTPTATTATTDLTAYFLAHQQTHIMQAYLIDGIAGIALLVFAAAVAGIFRESADENGIAANIIFGAGVAAASVSLMQAGMQQVLTNPAILAEGDAAPLRTILVLINATDTFKLLALALFTGMASLCIFYTGGLPQWLGWMGALLSLMLIVGGLSFLLSNSILFDVLVASLPLLLLWVAAVSVVILRQSRGTHAIRPAT